MIKALFTGIFFTLLSFFLTQPVVASGNSFVSIVNPIRGNDFLEGNQKPEEAVIGQVRILKQFNLSATWLMRFDVLDNQRISSEIPKEHEKGLFLEVTPSWATQAAVNYHKSGSWHDAGSAFLTGYETKEREKLIDSAFEKFNKIFGVYPKSVGAWWIDSYSLSYMQKKYGIISALIVADQYSTDNYQIWGQYFSTPYYPQKNNALHPAQNLENKIPIVISQWAARDPVNAYGNGVFESTFSVQANDYIDFHNLDTRYFSKLIDIYTKQPLDKFFQVVVGLENSYDWQKYSKEYENQIKMLANKRDLGQISLVSMQDFATWYLKAYPNLSPEQIIVADDPLGTYKKAVWFMNPYYRAAWFFNQEGSAFRDIRQYIDGEEELCFSKRCDSVNFATSATRVLDEVSFGYKLTIDEGKISDFTVKKSPDGYDINYKNEAGKQRLISFLPRDININGKISSIDTTILEATEYQLEQQKSKGNLERGFFNWSISISTIKIIKFLGFLILGCLVPGLLLINNTRAKELPFMQRINLGLVLGFTIVTLLFYLLSLFNLKQIIYGYLVLNLIIFVRNRKQLFSNFSFKLSKFNYLIIGLISLGIIFQQLPTFKNLLHFPYGYGLWGPNTHDGIWHISLINQLVKNVPPQNPIFSGDILKNYHYFFDLLISATHYVSGIPIIDLLFRFYPVVFSVSLGIGTYYLIKSIFKGVTTLQTNLSLLCGIYLVYFSGSFGWIVEYIKVKHLGGESAFWANQSISFNLNPPFAISLLMVIAILQLLPYKSKISILILSIFCGSLIAFKSYSAVLIMPTLLIVGILKKNISFLVIFFISSALSAVLFLSNFSINKQLILFSPFWFIHSMIDSPDRVGWIRLTLARVAGLEQGNWFKFFSSEIISLIIFVAGNLGMRIFALFSIVKIKTIFADTQKLFMFILSLLSLSIPILFIQAGNPWNTIQFIYYFLYISAIISGVILAKIILRVPKMLAIPIFITFVVLTPINSWATGNSYLSYQPHALISDLEMEALTFLKSQKEGVVITYPYDKNLKTKIAEPWPLFVYDSTAYVSALSGKSVYLEDEPQNQILLTDYKKKQIASKGFFLGSSSEQVKFLSDNNIKYIYALKAFNQNLSESNNLKNIFENKQVIIYQYIN